LRAPADQSNRAELGNAAWKVLHTTIAKFPDKPTSDDSQALKSFVHLFARLYPCGECARHFQQILAKFPPQASTRSAAAGWACHVHNEVNRSLKKEEFDCSKIGDFYDCGCADDEADDKEKGKDKDGFTQLELEKEG
jgi:FAD-linked sulfhydryl oxidase